MIKLAADALRESLVSAYGIYRMGGDEFIAIYIDKEEELIKSEIRRLQEACLEKSNEHAINVSMAVGYSYNKSTLIQLDDLIQQADEAMYVCKNTMKETRRLS